MWDALTTIYGGDKNVQRAKSKSLRGKFDDMRMEEGENIAQYVARIKQIVSAIKGATSKIDDDTMLSKFLRTLLPIYAIRVSTIQELRCILGNNLILEGLVGRLATFDIEVKENSKVSYLSFILIRMKLVILVLDVHKRKTIKVVINIRAKEMITTRTIETKERSHATLLKKILWMILMIMMMKWCMLQ